MQPVYIFTWHSVCIYLDNDLRQVRMHSGLQLTYYYRHIFTQQAIFAGLRYSQVSRRSGVGLHMQANSYLDLAG